MFVSARVTMIVSYTNWKPMMKSTGMVSWFCSDFGARKMRFWVRRAEEPVMRGRRMVRRPRARGIGR